MGQQAVKFQNGSGFNTQPPEGGWQFIAGGNAATDCFNTQPPEGGWDLKPDWNHHSLAVSTHSRLKAAGVLDLKIHLVIAVSTHSRLKAAGAATATEVVGSNGFNTQPPEGGW